MLRLLACSMGVLLIISSHVAYACQPPRLAEDKDYVALRHKSLWHGGDISAKETAKLSEYEAAKKRYLTVYQMLNPCPGQVLRPDGTKEELLYEKEYLEKTWGIRVEK